MTLRDLLKSVTSLPTLDERVRTEKRVAADFRVLGVLARHPHMCGEYLTPAFVVGLVNDVARLLELKR